jgi:MoaA/NifB/PqqE/SkfB family radical SAM enzyme
MTASAQPDTFAHPKITGGSNPLRVGWDNCTLEIAPLPLPEKDNMVDGTLPLRLAGGVRLRREHFGGTAQVGPLGYLLNPRACEVLERLARAFSPRVLLENCGTFSIVDLQRFLSSCRVANLIEIAPDESISRARLYGVRSEEPYRYLQSPLAVEIEITNKCFRHCSYCAYESGPTPKITREHELTTEQWLDVISNLEREGVMALEFTGGDPFVRDDALDLLRHAADLGLAILINSDLSILNEQHLDGLRSLKSLVSIQTSLDGATPASCDLTRGRGGFKTLMRQLAVLNDAGLPVSVGSTIHRHNVAEVEAVAELVASKGVDRLYIGPMYPAGRATTLNDLVLSGEQWDLAVNQYINVVKAGIVAPVDRLWYELAEDYNPLRNPVHDQLYITSRATRSLRLDPLGNAYVTAKLRQWHPRFWTVGNVLQFEVGTVWRESKLLNELRSYAPQKNEFDGLGVRTIESEGYSGPGHADELKPVKLNKRLSA